MAGLNFAPHGGCEAGPSLSVAAAEALLAEWFERPVVLTSSGRAAMLLDFAERGFNRYRHRIAVPPLISACVLEVVIRHAFPVDIATAGADQADLCLHYHQYGLPQRVMPSMPCLEDICHRFFATPTSGARVWAGDAAVFSLPKFFPMAGMSGGLVVQGEQRAERLRQRRDAAFRPDAATRASLRATFAQGYHTPATAPPGALAQLYTQLLTVLALDAGDLVGLPPSLAALAAVGERRADRIRALLDLVDTAAFPPGWAEALPHWLPFALPIFHPDLAQLTRWQAALQDQDIESGVYRIDTARNARAPQEQVALLIPCHDAIPAHHWALLTEVFS